MVKIVILFFLIFAPFELLAEGNCPPGYYPIGGQGAAGCAPIPQGNSGSGTEPRATGKWIKTWGAFAMSPDGTMGTSSGKLSKREALKAAIDSCNGSSQGCVIKYSFRNACIGMSQVIGGGVYTIESGPNLEAAQKNSDDSCKKKSGNSCKLIYSVCSEPLFKSF
ncbi:DUF4189 domain-containing protein [Xanthomonas campestris]|uniref:DUF4189 domain-containing protein n=1 Tax=Xanthomonas campestris TaxID=339 RepID=UPI000E0E925E|nr:DUF4189 domain-containing protein [Xanthomonas campestris pv. incanae]